LFRIYVLMRLCNFSNALVGWGGSISIGVRDSIFQKE
jgi:hypothetical protein